MATPIYNTPADWENEELGAFTDPKTRLLLEVYNQAYALATGGVINGADNGLTATAGIVQLGGPLIQNTSIDQAGFDLSISSGNFSFTSLPSADSIGFNYADATAEGYISLVYDSGTGYTTAALLNYDLVTGNEATVTVTSTAASVGFLDFAVDPNRVIRLGIDTNGFEFDSNKNDTSSHCLWNAWSGVANVPIMQLLSNATFSVGDISTVANKTTFILDDSAKTAAFIVDDSFTIHDSTGLRSFEVYNSGSVPVVDFGDIGSNANLTRFTLNDGVQAIDAVTTGTFNISLNPSTDRSFSVDTTNHNIQIGDLNTVANGTLLTVNDASQTIDFVATNGLSINGNAGVDFSGAITNLTIVKGIVTAAS